jgi:TPR repeat protein
LQPLAYVGDADAQFYLGLMHANGEGVPQNYAEAVKWFRSAADRGVSAAQYNLGILYARGQGLRQDYAEAKV